MIPYGRLPSRYRREALWALSHIADAIRADAPTFAIQPQTDVVPLDEHLIQHGAPIGHAHRSCGRGPDGTPSSRSGWIARHLNLCSPKRDQ